MRGCSERRRGNNRPSGVRLGVFLCVNVAAHCHARDGPGPKNFVIIEHNVLCRSLVPTHGTATARNTRHVDGAAALSVALPVDSNPGRAFEET
jgi:hypothetical protein